MRLRKSSPTAIEPSGMNDAASSSELPEAKASDPHNVGVLKVWHLNSRANGSRRVLERLSDERANRNEAPHDSPNDGSEGMAS
jgi:hypothetical protein